MARNVGSAVSAAFLGLAAFSVLCAPALAAGSSRSVTQAIDEGVRVELIGDVRPEARTAIDRGAVADSMVLDHMQLLLKRPPEKEEALNRLLDDLQDQSSPRFHQWLTAKEFGEQFGPDEADVAAVTDWLAAHGMTVQGVQPSRMMIDFSGTVAQVRSAFRTEIHRLDVGGSMHIANMSNPRIPAALKDIIEGVVSLHDFRPGAHYKAKREYTFSSSGTTTYAVAPADLATIYNLKPLFAAGISGQGQTITVIEDTDVYSAADWTTFRSVLGLGGYTGGSFAQAHPAGSAACTDPGVVAGDEFEAELDAEWASAAAPSAAIVLASCQNTATTYGGLIALQNLLNASTPPAIVSISYGECETKNGKSANHAFYVTFQQAATLGTSVYVAAGDSGAAGCDGNLSAAQDGLGVSGYASTPFNIAVGGTDFGDTYAKKNSTYWSASNGSTDGSALSYIDEIPWNDSCGSALIASFNGYGASYGAGGFCNSAAGIKSYLTTSAGSGGASGCAVGSPSASTPAVVSGTCAGYKKPAWQLVLGNPTDGLRDLPDVALFAADGVWNHFYVVCDSDVADQGAPCTGAPSGWSGAGGTSVATPIWAGFQALVNQKTAAKQGLPAKTLYKLARGEYGAGGNAACNSSKGNQVASSCIFYDVTQGDNEINCLGSVNCYLDGATNGIMTDSSAALRETYPTGVGWDFATGIGTVNVYNLVDKW
jgi:subtilase family serine protease